MVDFVEHEPDFRLQLAAARQGATWALRAVYRRLHPKLLRYVAAQAPEVADDVAHDVWLDVAANLDNFDGDETSFTVWVFTLARSRLTESQPLPVAQPSGGIRGVQDEGLRAALARIGALPEQEAEVILLRSVGGLATADVAQVVGRDEASVRTLQQRGIQSLVRRRTEEMVA